MLDEARERTVDRAAAEVDHKTSVLRDELGEFALDTLEAYFPEQAKARRRQLRVRALAVGVLIGLGVRTAARWWFGGR